jgi:hypothetical protein
MNVVRYSKNKFCIPVPFCAWHLGCRVHRILRNIRGRSMRRWRFILRWILEKCVVNLGKQGMRTGDRWK